VGKFLNVLKLIPAFYFIKLKNEIESININSEENDNKFILINRKKNILKRTKNLKDI